MVSMMDILSGAVPLMGMSVKAGQAQVALPVEGERPTWPAGTAGTLVGPLQDGVRDATTAQQPPTSRVAVALVADQVVGPLAGPTPPGRSWDAMASRTGSSWVLS
jgi:hypothetical protein